MIFLDFKSNLVYSNPQMRVPRGSKHPDIMKIEVVGLSDYKIEKLSIRNEAESAEQFYGAFRHIFSAIHYENGALNQQTA